MSKPERQDPESRPSDRLVAVGVVEFIALLIGLVTPITPSKTGSTWSPANLFTADPSYLQKVLASFVTVNLIFLLLGLVVWVATKLDMPK